MPNRLLQRSFLSYLAEFMHDSRAVGILLFSCTVVSMLLANVSWGAGYVQLFVRELPGMHALHLPHILQHWVNDFGMAIFFFLVGMEIKRELLIGELNSISQSVFPVAAAIGGMVAPAAIFLLFNKGTGTQVGWGIPMATDIAFALGVASLLGNKVPRNLKIFLMALAIIDDLGAILVIAFFYGGALQTGWFLLAALLLTALVIINKKGKNYTVLNVLIGAIVWYATYRSGIHATLAGVALAFCVSVNRIEYWEHKMHNVVNFLVLPFFALANTCISLGSSAFQSFDTRLALGIMLGLVVGKPLGIFVVSRFVVHRGWARLPAGVTWHQLLGAGVLAGIGFTMSIFIACLAFADASYQDQSKLFIMVSALVSTILSFMWFYLLSPAKQHLPD
jgi:NhaA family Na+:H+ antiporter